jgi:beta-lactamase regulating signal transducer with metallopeptidase domain
VSETKTLDEQENLQSDMMNLAKTLKERTQSINHSLAEDAKILDAVGQSAESSAELLEREQSMLKKQLESSIGVWTSIWLVLMLVCVFILMYIYIKLFSRRF